MGVGLGEGHSPLCARDGKNHESLPGGRGPFDMGQTFINREGSSGKLLLSKDEVFIWGPEDFL